MLYQALFDAIVQLINERLSPDRDARPPTLGGGVGGGTAAAARARGVALLDVFGFEVLPSNSLEQLLINFTNEKLHQHFLRCTVKEESRLYRAEGLLVTVGRDKVNNVPGGPLHLPQVQGFQLVTAAGEGRDVCSKQEAWARGASKSGRTTASNYV